MEVGVMEMLPRSVAHNMLTSKNYIKTVKKLTIKGGKVFLEIFTLMSNCQATSILEVK